MIHVRKNKNGNYSFFALQERIVKIKILIELESNSEEIKLLRKEMKELSKIIKKENLKNS